MGADSEQNPVSTLTQYDDRDTPAPHAFILDLLIAAKKFQTLRAW